MAITERKLEEQNAAQAPTLGMGAGTFGQQAQQRTNITQGGSGRFTNLQQYIKANEANPNAQLLQREGTRRQEELGTRQGEFTRQAEPIKQQFEGIRSGQQFVQSALQDPTKVVQDPRNIERFAQYRTQGIGDVERPFQQLQTARGTLGTQQEQLASGLETIQRDPNALQNFIQSQRANPALATRGENVLDRFLTQSTQSGQKAIAGLGTTAEAIRGTQAPSIIQDVESLRTQAQGGPLASSDVVNLLSGAVKPEEDYIKGIDNLFVASRVGLGNKISPIKSTATANRIINPTTGMEEIVYTFEQLPTLPTYQKPQTISQASENDIKRAKKQYDDYNYYTKAINDIDNEIAISERVINSYSNSGIDPFDPQKQQLQQAKDSLSRQREEKTKLMLGASNRDYSLVPLYQEYINLAGTTRQNILQNLDPTRLSRIQALQQLTGSTPFDPLLQTRLT